MGTEKDIRLIALDLDGTLTNDEKKITPETKEALMEAQRMGVRLCLASGRPPFGMMPLVEELEMARYGGILMAYNGGYVMDCQSGKVITEVILDDSLLFRLHEYQELSGMTLMTYHNDKIYTEHPNDYYVHISSRNNRMKVVGVENFTRDVPKPVNKCLMVGEPADVPYWEKEMQDAFCGEMHILRSTPYFIELLPLGIDKGPALSAICNAMGMSVGNAMAFGDSYNDISMIKAAGIGVAMENAEDAVKASADIVTLNNNADGVAKVVKDFILSPKR